MLSAIFINKLSRSETYPKLIELESVTGKGHVSLKPLHWTAQMFYELHSIKIGVYDDTELVYERFVKTYLPVFPPDSEYEIIVALDELPKKCTISITPIFDDNSVKARNNLILAEVEQGELWESETQTFDIDIIVKT